MSNRLDYLVATLVSISMESTLTKKDFRKAATEARDKFGGFSEEPLQGEYWLEDHELDALLSDCKDALLSDCKDYYELGVKHVKEMEEENLLRLQETMDNFYQDISRLKLTSKSTHELFRYLEDLIHEIT